MDTTIANLVLRVSAFSSSLRTQVQNAFRACLNLYSPETWLVIYFPLFYFVRVVNRYSQWVDEQPEGNSLTWLSLIGYEEASPSPAYGSSIQRRVCPFIILSLICCLLFLYYHTLVCRSSGATSLAQEASTSVEESIYDATSKAPERLLQTTIDAGLTKDEVSQRQRKYGPNEIVVTRSWFRALLRLALGTTNLVLKAAALFALYLRDWTELAIICGLLAFNFFIAIQSIRHYDDIAKTLVGDLSGYHVTRRGGALIQVMARELVPGDIVRVEQGQVIMFEGRVVATDGRLCTDQSNLTGQRTPISKGEGDMCYPSSGIVSGKATLIVVATGHHTFIGRTLRTVENPMPSHSQPSFNTPPPHHVREYWRLLRSIAVTFGILTFIVLSFFWKFSNQIASSYTKLNVSLALTIPVYSYTLTQLAASLRARGAEHLSKQGALLQTQQFTNAECLASIDVFCSDKTGTLTENKLSLQEPYCVSCDKEDIILTACLSCPPDHENLDPIDKAIFEELIQYPLVQSLLERYTISEYVSFDVVAKRTWAWAESSDGRRTLCTKGAPKAIFELCAPALEAAEAYKHMASKLASQGIRSLGVARKPQHGEWELLGLLPMFDPTREDTASTIQLARTLGIAVKMLTGDAKAVAEVTANSLGIGTKIANAALCSDDTVFSDADICISVEAADGYAEVFPENKEKIIQILQCQGHRVAATGDGVNDAYSLRRADCGIAVEGSTEIAISASDIYMQISGFAAMLRAIQVLRQTFRMVWTYIAYRTTLSLHLVCILIWHLAAYNEFMDLNLVLLIIHFSDIVGLALLSESQHTPFPKKPARWSTRGLLKSVIPISAVLTIGTWLSLTIVSTPYDVAETSVTRQQIIFLHTILSDHWLFLISRVHSRLRLQVRDQRAIATILSLGVLATLACVFGWLGERQQMSIEVALRVWIYSFATVCTAASLRLFILDEELTEMR